MTIPDEMKAKSDTPQAPAPDVRLPHQAREVIGSRLRRIYGGLVAEPLPDRFQDLLVRLAAAEAQAGPEDDAPEHP